MTRLLISAAALVALAVAAFALAFAHPAAALGTCPDQFFPVLATEPEDIRKDNNNNGFVCKKLEDGGKLVGGPDDTQDDLTI